MGEGEPATVYLDVSADGTVSPLDALLIINELNRMSDAEGEPTTLAAIAAAVDSTSGEATIVDGESAMTATSVAEEASAKPRVWSMKLIGNCLARSRMTTGIDNERGGRPG